MLVCLLCLVARFLVLAVQSFNFGDIFGSSGTERMVRYESLQKMHHFANAIVCLINYLWGLIVFTRSKFYPDEGMDLAKMCIKKSVFLYRWNRVAWVELA